MTDHTAPTIQLDDAYPEHAKMREVADKSQAIGDFLDWVAQHRNGQLVAYEPRDLEITCPDIRCDRGKLSATFRGADRDCPRCGGSGVVVEPILDHYPLRNSDNDLRKLLAEFFGIDQDKLEAEKQAMLEALR